MRFQAEIPNKDAQVLQSLTRDLEVPLLERAAPDADVPSVEIDWTPEELASLDQLASQGPAKPNARLKELMKQTG